MCERRTASRFGARRHRRPLPDRQEYLERRALTDLAGDFDPTRMLLHDAMDRGKPQAGAFAHVLGRVEWVEDTAKNLRTHPAAAVRTRQANKLPRARLEPAPGTRLVEHRKAGRNTDGSAVRHSIPGIQRQVNDDLLHIAFVRADGRQVGGAVQAQLVRLADESPEHLGEAL